MQNVYSESRPRPFFSLNRKKKTFLAAAEASWSEQKGRLTERTKGGCGGRGSGVLPAVVALDGEAFAMQLGHIAAFYLFER